MFDATKLKLYYDYILNTVKDEGEDPVFEKITEQVIDNFIVPLNLKKNAKILDIGSGTGCFADYMKKLGYTNITCTTMTTCDEDALRKKGHNYIKTDINFISKPDNSYDFIFCRHTLEHSPFPYIALLEYNRLLNKKGKIYVEMPQPNGLRGTEINPEHYSILGEIMLQSLISKAGFVIDWYRNAQIPITHTDTKKVKQENYNCVLATKVGNIEVK